MAPKNKKKGSGRRFKTPGQTSASNPNPTTTSSSVSSPTGDATTTSVVPSSAFPTAPPTTTTTTGLAGPSTSPSASAASTSTRTFSPLTDVFENFFAPAVAWAMTALQTRTEEDPANEAVISALFGLQLDEMELMLRSLLGLVEIMKGNTEPKVAISEDLFNMNGLRSAIKLTEVLLSARKKRPGSGGSCGGSKGGGGSPAGGSGEGDGEGGGVGV